MAKSKLTLIVDGNWLLMSRLPIVNARYADDATLMNEVKTMMIKSINVVLRTFPMIDNVLFVSDGGSWRKDIPVPQFIIDKKKASIGNLQRMFKIGFNRAARIMDQLSEAGVVGEEQGTKPREILMTAEQFEELLRQTQ